MLVGFDKDEIIDFVPKYGNNRDSDDPCIVRLRFVPFSKVQSYSRMLAARVKGTTNLGKIAEIERGIQRKQFIDSVESISGYIMNDGRLVTDPTDFYDNTVDTNLVIEIVRAMESHSKLDEGQLKNFLLASDSDLSVRTEAPSTVKIVPKKIEKTGIAATDFDLEDELLP